MKKLLRRLCVSLSSVLLAFAAQAQDATPPTIDSRSPAPNSTVRRLSEVEVVFSEAVTNVDASDLLMNGVAAINVFGGVPGQYVWQFPAPPTGQVTIAFAAGHGITDLATPANAFAGGSWTVTFDPNALVYGVVISEFMAENDNGIHDEDGDTSDWIELFNASDVSVNLGGWFLTDEVIRPTKWRLPSVEISPKGYLLIWASSKNRTNNVLALHANFSLERAGEYLALLDPRTNVVSAFAPRYPAQVADVSFGRDRIDPTLTGFYNPATPRANNVVSGAGVLPEVQFSRLSSTFVDPFELSLSVDSTNAIIRYLVVTNRLSATNVNFLSATNLLTYTGPITVQSSWQIRARAFPKPGTTFFPGPFRTESYIQLNPNVLNFNSDLPLVIIHDFAAGPYDQTDTQREETSVIAFFEPGTDRSSLTNQPVLVSRAGINARGSSTLGYQKVSLAVELWSEINDDAHKPVLGMKPESDWVFYAPNNFEPVLFHNPLYYQLSRDVGRWAPNTRYAEVFLNTSANPVGTNHYNGIYVVTEKIKRSPNRVDIPRMEVEDTNAPAITGGYMLSIDRQDSSERSFSTTGAFSGAPVNIQSYGLIYVDPSGRDGMNIASAGPRDPQERYIANYINTMITNLASATFTNVPKIYEQHIDVDSWIDHVHIAMAAYNVDAVRLSGYLFKDRNKRIEFGPAWDCDRCMGSTDGRELQPRTWTGTGDRSDFFNPGGSLPSFWFQRLFRDLDFWQKYVDRYQELREGAFHLTNIFARIDQNVELLTNAYPREFAKWRQLPRRASVTNANGTYTLTTGGATYATEVQWKKEWFSARFNFLDTNHLDRPQVSLSSGMVPAGTTVTLTPAAKAGSYVIYTLDGTDPRAPHGRISPVAFSNLGPVTLTITNNAHVVVRSFNPTHRNMTGTDRPPLSTPWSGPRDAVFVVETPALRITEIMYHPAAPLPGNTNDADNFEYIELKNTGSTALNVGGFQVRGGIDVTLGNVTLAAGQSGVVVRDLAAFQSRYPGAGPILGVFTNNLANNGERLVLEGPVDEPILDFRYNDKWYPITDGHGFSLQIINDLAARDAWGFSTNWRPSGVFSGTPGAADPGDPGITPIVINELLSHTDLPVVDTIELRNLGSSDANIGHWYLTDDFGTPKKFRIPANTMIPAGATKTFSEADFNAGGANSFSFSSLGDEAYLFSGSANGDLSGYVHGFDFGAQANGVTFGRYVISTGNDHFVRQASATLNAPNSGPAVGPVVVSEINYHPVDIPLLRGFRDNDGDEFIELQNITSSPVPLFDPVNPANTWRLRDAVDFDFAPGVTLAPNEVVLIVSFTPTNGPTLAGFRQRNNVAPNTRLFGPWNGQLDNSSDAVELFRPDAPDPLNGFVPYVLVERVNYKDVAPWPSGADGIGPSLQRIVVSSYGNDPTNWVAGGLSAGLPYVATGLPTIVQQPQNQTNIAYNRVVISVVAGGPGPTTYQWRFRGTPIFGATGPNLVLPNAQPGQAGEYDVVVLNPGGSVTSEKVTLTLKIPMQFVAQPATQALRVGSNVTFSVAVQSTAPPVTYQWQFNGRNIPGATSPSLTINNIDVQNDGEYVCVATDGISSSNSAPARLFVLIVPTILVHPKPQAITSNGLAGFSVLVTNTATKPLGYRWRRNGQTVAFYVLNDTSSVFVTNATGAGTYTVVVTNAALTSGAISEGAELTVALDTDGDGIPDDVELALGLNPNDPADAALDTDGDRMSNLDESIAGTDPRDPNSVLRVTRIVSDDLARIEFNAVSNRSYVVQGTPTLGQGRRWTLVGNVAVRTTNFTATVIDRGPLTNRFYRLVTPGTPLPQ